MTYGFCGSTLVKVCITVEKKSFTHDGQRAKNMTEKKEQGIRNILPWNMTFFLQLSHRNYFSPPPKQKSSNINLLRI